MELVQTVRAAMRPVAPGKRSLPYDILDALHELNQSALDTGAIVTRKRALIADYRRTRP
ncbi:hypothetical protein [Yoonia sp.]|uniref:hypothetical protein n=1 Tax=Yoonia sp. TaxID=2212373 RepID=UPI0025FD1958|nr:hypothetical protein [Yoonia sp.]